PIRPARRGRLDQRRREQHRARQQSGTAKTCNLRGNAGHGITSPKANSVATLPPATHERKAGGAMRMKPKFGGMATKSHIRRRAPLTLVPRTRSSHDNCRESDCELRVQSGTRIIDLLVSFDSEVRIGVCRMLGRTSESGH